ncbi:unnamed protein product [Laminaria digitata]
MAGSRTMAAAVSFLTHEPGAPKLKLDEVKALIDGHTAAVIRGAVFNVADGRATNKFDEFARSTNAAATCSTEGTAGENGLDECLAGCEQKRYFLARTPNKGACHMLCALASSPCTKDVAGTTTIRPVSWGTMSTDWGKIVTFWILMTVVFPLWVVHRVYINIHLRALKARCREADKQLEMSRRETAQLDLVLEAIEREPQLLDDAIDRALQDLAAWEIDRDLVIGDQRRAQDGQLSVARGARLRREGEGGRMFRGRG